jgi:acyl-CoA thioester hydrolase
MTHVPGLTPASAHHRNTLRVYWEDTDAGGIVFYGNYLKFMERARTDWLRHLGFSQEAMRTQGQGMFVVSDTHLRYLRPARLDDELTVTASLIERGRASLMFRQAVCRGDELLCHGDIRIGWVQRDADGQLRPARMPADIVNALPTPLLLNPS